MLPIMLEAAKRFTGYHFVIAMAPSQSESLYKDLLKEPDSVSLLSGETYPILSQARAAMVTSGTATLETALFGVPEVVCYKGNTMSYWIARQLVKIKYISLVNLIMDREVVCELIQDEMQPERLFEEMKKVIEEGESRTTMLQQFQKLKELLGGAGASENAASLIINYMHKGT